MTLEEAKQILLSEGYDFDYDEEEIMSMNAANDADRDRTILHKLEELYKLLKLSGYKMKLYFDKHDKYIDINLGYNRFTARWHFDYQKYDIYYTQIEDYESFDTAEEVVEWLFED